MATGNKLTAANLIPELNRIHKEIISGVRSSLEKARSAGEVLIRIKELCKHGQFEKIVEEQCDGISPRTARLYMAIANGWDEIMERLGPGQATQLTLTDGIRLISRRPSSERGQSIHNTADEGSGAEAAQAQNNRGPQERAHGGVAALGGGDNPPNGVVSGAECDQPLDCEGDYAWEMFTEAESHYVELTRLLDKLQVVCPWPDKDGIQVALNMSYDHFRRWKRSQK